MVVCTREETEEALSPAESGTLLGVLQTCHDYLYANEGLTAEKVFREMVWLLTAKLLDDLLRRPDGSMVEVVIR